MGRINIAGRWVGDGEPTYFIADIAANHDGSLDRAVRLIHLAAEAGADAAKFQNFRAPQIVSRHGFDAMGSQVSHQAKWKKSVFQVYQEASVPWEWTETLKKECDKAKVHYYSTPYDLETIDHLDPFVPAFKIGSGDITWTEEIEHIAKKGKPTLLATGASDIGDVQRAVAAFLKHNRQLLLMQCNTNYTGSIENFRCVQLNVLKTFAAMYPDLPLGLSDHTPGHTAVLGAVALGARAVEKHFTDDTKREGPDHGFSLDPRSWREMVDRTRELEYALGDGNKTIQPNERDTAMIQRRCLYAARALAAGTKLTRRDITPLRPAYADGIFPYDLDRVVGRAVRRALAEGDHLRWTDLE
ncbi:MAG TPA: N-acetylneuraminate synthase family protein [Gemmataceae bacterium]|jgi:N-acetylneuraminate synthase|nr:N-acetylneuraminate synthase family protein [Gemmataceae bacterium]